MTAPPLIEPLAAGDLAEFIAYLNDHLADNGTRETGYFQPLPRSSSFFPADRMAGFRTGFDAAVGAKGWRRVWVARSGQRQIVGHIDLRSHPDGFAEHRCLLGMGVDKTYRRMGLGTALIDHARHWASNAGRLEWIDLQVISENQPAVELYLRAGFVRAGEIIDMFRLDGKSLSYTTMSMRLDLA